MRLCLEHQHTLNLLPVSMGMISEPSDKKKIENKDFTQPFYLPITSCTCTLEGKNVF